MPNTPADFWNWFVTAQDRFRDVDVPEREQLLDELLEHLHGYCDGLYFEVGGMPGAVSELVITAEGNADYFGAVQDLVAAAPAIAGWRFIAFRPPMGFTFSTRYEDVTIDPAASWFLPLVHDADPTSLGLRLAVPDYDESEKEAFTNAAFIVIDTALGELIAARDVHHIEVCEIPDDPEGEGFIELPELTTYLDWRGRRSDA